MSEAKAISLLLDEDRGFASVKDEIDAGLVVRQPIKTYQEADAKVWELLRADKSTLHKYTIFDSLDGLALRVIEKIAVGPNVSIDEPGAVWREVSKPAEKMGYLASQPEYKKLASSIIQLLWNFETLTDHGTTFIFTAGEEVREDGVMGAMKLGPSLSPMIRGMLLRYSDLIGRLGVLNEPQELKDLDGKAKKFPAETRVLRLQPNDAMHAKSRARRSRWASGQFLPLLPNPTIPRILENLGAESFDEVETRKICLYGSAGTGKTTLACSGR